MSTIAAWLSGGMGGFPSW